MNNEKILLWRWNIKISIKKCFKIRVKQFASKLYFNRSIKMNNKNFFNHNNWLKNSDKLGLNILNIRGISIYYSPNKQS